MRYNLISRIKRILDIQQEDTSVDNVIGILLQKNEVWIRDICGIPEEGRLDNALVNLLEDLTIMSYNKIGSEGFNSESMGPITIQYADLPERCKEVISRHKRVRF